MSEKDKRFVKDARIGTGGIILLILAGIAVFGALGYALVFHADALSLPRPG